jgi:hypothetical protein
MTEKKLKSTTFGSLPKGMWFVLLGDWLQRGMYPDKPKSPVRYVKVSDRRYINAHSLINGKIPPESRIKQVAHQLSSNHVVVICPRGWG